MVELVKKDIQNTLKKIEEGIGKRNELENDVNKAKGILESLEASFAELSGEILGYNREIEEYEIVLNYLIEKETAND